MNYQFYNQLPQEAKKIREKVFMEEQGFRYEFDDIDEKCWHLVVYECDEAIGCARMYDEKGDMVLGRIAVVKDKRHRHLGSYILHELEKKAKELGYDQVRLSAQVQASEFYHRNGYEVQGEEYLDEFCPHVCMVKKLVER